MDLKTHLANQISQKGFLIVSHRGAWGGNIIQNTIQSTALASRLGADIVEIDICRTVDGEYYLFHEGHEKDLLQEERLFSEMPLKKLKGCPFIIVSLQNRVIASSLFKGAREGRVFNFFSSKWGGLAFYTDCGASVRTGIL